MLHEAEAMVFGEVVCGEDVEMLYVEEGEEVWLSAHSIVLLALSQEVALVVGALVW